MSNNNIVPKTRSNDEEESSIKMEKSNLQSTQPRMTAEQQQEVLCNESGREGEKKGNVDSYPAISSEAKIHNQDVKELGKVGNYPTSSGVDPPSKNIQASTEPTDSEQPLKPMKNEPDHEVIARDSGEPMTGSSYSTQEAWRRLEEELTQFLSLDTEIQDRSNTSLIAGAYETDDTHPISLTSGLVSDISFLPTRQSSLLEQRPLSPTSNERLESESNAAVLEDGDLQAKGGQ